jgi:hypothetical protein
MTIPKINKMLNETPNKKHEMLIDQALKNQKREEKMPYSITNNEEQQNLSLNNSHSSRQINSGGKDYFIKTPNMNDDLKERFTKISNMKNGGLIKHKKPLITNQKERENSHRKTHHKNQIEPKKHDEDRPRMKFKLAPQMKLNNGSQLMDFQIISMNFQSMFIKTCNTRKS